MEMEVKYYLINGSYLVFFFYGNILYLFYSSINDYNLPYVIIIYMLELFSLCCVIFRTV